MKRNARQLLKAASLVALCASLLLFAPAGASAQSTDLGSPTPVYNSQIDGRIAPLDVGDPRRTRHFYIFNAHPGDLEITVEANNLDGEIDLFTAAAMRPLAQVTLYSGLGSNVARTVFFRRDEAVILRVQARSPNDTDGTYRIRLGGTFAPSTLPPPEEAASNTAPAASRERPAPKGLRRVNSIGARIEEPKTEAPVETAATERTETPSAPDETATTPKPAATTKSAPARSTTSNRTTPARRGAARRGAATRTNAPAAESAKADAGKTETTESTAASGETAPEETGRDEAARKEPARSAANRARGTRTRGSRASAESRPAEKSAATSGGESAAPASAPNSAAPAATGLEAPGSRIVLELRDGTRIEREMSEVRRVAVEGRLVVITLKNGRIERQPLANIARMSIEP